MVLHQFAPSTAPRTLRVVGFAVAYALALATGTAMLIGALGSHDDGRVTGPGGLRITAAELVMQQTSERGQVQRESMLLARNEPNDKRGF